MKKKKKNDPMELLRLMEEAAFGMTDAAYENADTVEDQDEPSETVKVDAKVKTERIVERNNILKREKYVGKENYRKEFIKLFLKMCRMHDTKTVWNALIFCMAAAFTQITDFKKEREEEYLQCIKVLDVDIAPRLLAIVINAYEEDPEQDFLGEIYMQLNIGDPRKGQHFTPYHVAHAMSLMTDGGKEYIEGKGYVSVCDPCCGSGVMLVAKANALRENGINFQTQTLFVGQDLDRTTALMCVVQLSILGCPGYVYIGNSLTNPPAGHELFPKENGNELWITPFFFREVWEERRMIEVFKELMRKTSNKEEIA